MKLELVYEVLDLQVVDVNGRRCGRVDDIELDLGENLESGSAVALLVGDGVYPDRMPGTLLPRLARRLVGEEMLGRNVIRVPWEEIDEIGPAVKLKRPAEELGLGRTEDALSPIMSRLLMVPERKR